MIGGPCAHCGPTGAKTRDCVVCGLFVCPSCYVSHGCWPSVMRGDRMSHAAAVRAKTGKPDSRQWAMSLPLGDEALPFEPGGWPPRAS